MKDALTPLPGVAGVDVDFGNRIATCKIDDEDKFDVNAALDTLAKAEFPATIVE